jgi:HAD superfamily hydrolase (TIGR01509 family)
MQNTRHPSTAALFDLDGTLVDTEPLHLRAEREALASLGVTDLAADHPRTFGAGIAPGMRMLAERYGFASGDVVFEAYVPKWEALFRTELRPTPGASEALAMLREAGVACALVTSGEREYVDLVMARFGWGEMFSAVVTLESVTRLKPDPEPYLKALAALRLPASASVGFEDSASGMRALKAAGVYAVGVHRDPERRAALTGADETIAGFDELGPEDVRRLFGR